MDGMSTVSQPADRPDVDLGQLLEQFYSDQPGHGELGQFTPVASVPVPYDRLLDHHAHMTVTVEAYLGQLVDVLVHRTDRQANWYAREITLAGTQSGKIIQYGIVRLNVDVLAPEVWRRIESQEVPLGRVLIEHNVLREVQLCGLWRVEAGPALARFMDLQPGRIVYGRTALIYCDGHPTIELLEIVNE